MSAILTIWKLIRHFYFEIIMLLIRHVLKNTVQSWYVLMSDDRYTLSLDDVISPGQQ